MSKRIEIPFRIAFTSEPGKFAAVGYPGSHGDAGWTTYRAIDADDARGFMRDNAAARMPCWAQLEKKLGVTA